MASSVIRGDTVRFLYSEEYDANTQPSGFPVGITVMTTSGSTTYPGGYGTIVTVLPVITRGFQLCISPTSGNNMKIRLVNNGVWTAWVSAVS